MRQKAGPRKRKDDVKTKRVYAVFRGYLVWDTTQHIWNEDEWLVGLYSELRLARGTVEAWGEGREWDNNRELQITRYYGKRRSLFEQGEEITEGLPAVCEKQWLRYSEYELLEEADEEWKTGNC